jgi:hypothetical protein
MPRTLVDLLAWFRRSLYCSVVFDDEFMNISRMPAGSAFMYRFLIDTRKHVVVAVPKRYSHLKTAGRHLGLKEQDLTQQNAGHLVGGLIVEERGMYLAQIKSTSFSDERRISYDKRTIAVAEEIMKGFLRRSIISRKSAVQVLL